MEYCYPDNKRRCVCGGIEHKCSRCGKVISDCEWVANWTTCAECFDKHARAHDEVLRPYSIRD